MKLANASGYPGIEGTPLARIGYEANIIELVWERDFIPLITNGSIDEELVMCNQTVQFTRQPRVGKWRNYSKNQKLIADHITPETMCMEINCAIYKVLKFDDLDIRQMCNGWEAWEASFLNSTYKSYVAELRDYVLNRMLLETARENQGVTAGLNGEINLGSLTAPIVLTKDNIIQVLARPKVVLDQQQRWSDGDMFLVVPTALESLILQSTFANAAWSGDETTIARDGVIERSIVGFDPIMTNHCPMAVTPTGDVGYYLIAGQKDAYAFVHDIIKADVKELVTAFGTIYRMLAVYGGKALVPEALVTLFVVLEGL